MSVLNSRAQAAVVAVVTSVLLSLLGGCGGGSGATSTSSSDTSSSSSSSSTAPSINTQPSTQSVAAGASVTFAVTAAGSATLSYQWRKDGTAITGATSSTYTIASVSTSDAGSYTVVVSNSAGSVTSSAATLTVTTATTASSAQSVAVYSAAMTFYDTLSSSQKNLVYTTYSRSTVQTIFDLATARHWSNLPASMVARNGVPWSSLSTTQQSAARTLIATALGDTGNALHVGMQAADDYLVASGASSGTYGNGNYYIAFLGTPSTSSFWMLQLTGHHLTFNIAFNGSTKTPTPLFMGVEPKGSFTLSGTTYDPMQAQREAWGTLGAALSSLSAAKLSGTWSDIVFGANGSGGIDGSCPRAYSTYDGQGLLYSSLSTTVQTLVQNVIKAYVNTQSTEYADDLLAAYLDSTALAQTYVAYSGDGGVATRNNYFRISGPRVWIEMSVQNGVIFNSDIHYHGVWRDKTGDYGGQCSAS